MNDEEAISGDATEATDDASGTVSEAASEVVGAELAELAHDEIRLVTDGDSMTLFGDQTVIDLFLSSEGLTATGTRLPALHDILGTGGAVAQSSAEIAANGGRWMKLTEEAAAAVKKYGLRESSKSGLSTGVIRGQKGGQIGGFVSFVKTPGSLVTNPAVLTGIGGVMAQLAMQQAIGQVTDYLATIDAKVDQVIRSQKDQQLARVIGDGLAIENALQMRETKGHVDAVTWSKVQDVHTSIGYTQSYALLQIDGLATDLERQSKVGDIAKSAKKIEAQVRDWLGVLARSFQLQDAFDIVELDHVMHTAPEEVDEHRVGLLAIRQQRIELIGRSTERLLRRLDAAAGTANAKILIHPSKSPAVVESRNEVVTGVLEFHKHLGIETSLENTQARRWSKAFNERTDQAVLAGAKQADKAINAAIRAGTKTKRGASHATARVTQGVSDVSGRARRRT